MLCALRPGALRRDVCDMCTRLQEQLLLLGRRALEKKSHVITFPIAGVTFDGRQVRTWWTMQAWPGRGRAWHGMTGHGPG